MQDSIDESKRSELQRTRVTRRGVAAIASLHQLKVLTLSGFDVSAESLGELHVARTLEFLQIDNCDLGNALLDHIKVLPALKQLNLAETLVTGEGLRQLAQNPGLAELWLQDTSVDDSFVAYFRGFMESPQKPRLRRLVISPHTMSREGFSRLKAVAPFVEVIELPRTPPTRIPTYSSKPQDVRQERAAFELLNRVAMARMITVKSQPDGVDTRIIGVELFDAGGEMPVGDWCCAYLQLLKGISLVSLRNAHVSGAGLSLLTSLVNLNALDLDGSFVGDDDIKCITSKPKLEFLSLSNTKFTDKASVTIAKCKELQTLTVSDTRITDTGIEKLAAIPKLRNLSAASCRVTDTGAKRMLEFPSLEFFKLTGGVSEEVAAQLDMKYTARSASGFPEGVEFLRPR